jgi:hypothetical protein
LGAVLPNRGCIACLLKILKEPERVDVFHLRSRAFR